MALEGSQGCGSSETRALPCPGAKLLVVFPIVYLLYSLSMGKTKTKNDLMPGTLDMMVLKTLSIGRMHGYSIAQAIQRITDSVLDVEEGSLYPALQRLELNGWIEGEWGLSANNRRARFYRLTPAGRKQLQAEAEKYRQMTGAIARVMGWA